MNVVSIGDQVKQMVYSNNEVRGPWTVNSNGMMVKVLAAGNAGLSQQKDAVNNILADQGLPAAKAIKQEEALGSLKNYLVLFVDNSFWKEKIEPVISFYKEYQEALFNSSNDEELKSALLKMKASIPSKELLLSDMQDKIKKLGIFEQASVGHQHSDSAGISAVVNGAHSNDGMNSNAALDRPERYDIYY